MKETILFRGQLSFDPFKNQIVEESIRYWKTMEEVPKTIQDAIFMLIHSRMIYDRDTKQYYCSKCLKILNRQFVCKHCGIQYHIPVSKNEKYIIPTSIKNIKEYEERIHFFYFDIMSDQILIYKFGINTCYHHPMLVVPYQLSKITIEEVYQITKEGLLNLSTGYFASFQEYNKMIDSEDIHDDLFNLFECPFEKNFLYTNNLADLKNTSLYKYTSIWELQSYLEKNNLNLATLTYYPIYCKQFEYLVKMKLYCLATNSADRIQYKQSFKNTFGIDKKYDSFMKEIDINLSQLFALRLYPTTDVKIINFISIDVFLFEKLLKYVSPEKIKIYLENQGLDDYSIYDYYDYIECCKKLKFPLHDKQVLFPKNFLEQHKKLIHEKIIATDPNINEKITFLANILHLNRYEDEKYIIFPADSVASLIDESYQMSNCVRNYCIDVSNNECQIYFMRYKEKIQKSLLTIEVRNGKIVQAKTRFNEPPTDEMNEILKKWEKQIIPIINEKRKENFTNIST